MLALLVPGVGMGGGRAVRPPLVHFGIEFFRTVRNDRDQFTKETSLQYTIPITFEADYVLERAIGFPRMLHQSLNYDRVREITGPSQPSFRETVAFNVDFGHSRQREADFSRLIASEIDLNHVLSHNEEIDYTQSMVIDFPYTVRKAINYVKRR